MIYTITQAAWDRHDPALFVHIGRGDVLVVPQRGHLGEAYRRLKRAQPARPPTDVCIVDAAVAACFVAEPPPSRTGPPMQLALWTEAA